MCKGFDMTSESEIDLLPAIEDKLKANEERYDAETVAENTNRLATWQRDTDS